MQKFVLSYPVNPFEYLFIDKGLELLFRNSIDSYRLRLHNPKTLIEELISVCRSSIAGLLTNNDYANSIAKELTHILEEENHGLKFAKVSKKHFKDNLAQISGKNYALIIQSSKLILKDNFNYLISLFDELVTLTSSFSTLVNDGSPESIKNTNDIEKNIVVLANHLFVELVNKGFNKQYLYNFFQKTFIRNTTIGLSYSHRLDILKTLLTKAKENFTIIFPILGNSFQFKEFKKIDNGYELVNKKYRKTIESRVSQQVNEFLEQNKETPMVYLKVSALDYLKAIEISMNKISKDMDIYHLGFTKQTNKVADKCAVIGDNDPSRSATFPSNFQIDGYVRSNANVFNILLDKIKRIEQNNVDKESYDKLLSAIRYYRTGSESPELETKLLNYWIGLEYIFTSTKTDEKVIEKIRTFFPVCHSLVYIRRNLHDFHVTLDRLGVSQYIPDYSDTLDYLTKHSTYQQIITHSPNELLKFRAKYFKKWQESPGNIDYALRKHSTNLIWNITRLYRIRNEIVHNAAIKKGIHVHISHMKYYLMFILNSILDFMAEVHLDVDNDGKVSIEDYFIAQNIMLGSLKGNTIKEYIKVDNPSQILL
jgi:hypothetical protein